MYTDNQLLWEFPFISFNHKVFYLIEIQEKNYLKVVDLSDKELNTKIIKIPNPKIASFKFFRLRLKKASSYTKDKFGKAKKVHQEIIDFFAKEKLGKKIFSC